MPSLLRNSHPKYLEQLYYTRNSLARLSTAWAYANYKRTSPTWTDPPLLGKKPNLFNQNCGIIKAICQIRMHLVGMRATWEKLVLLLTPKLVHSWSKTPAYFPLPP